VAHVIAGSVRRSESRVRIVATLIAGADEDVLWSATYDRELRDIFEVQSEVAASIATAVRRELTTADKASIASRGTTNPEAYDSFLRARALWEERTEATVGASLRYFERAIEADPAFALAHASLAEAYTILGIYGARPPKDVFPLARQSATKALALNPSLGEAVAAGACISAAFDWDWVTAERGFVEALSLSPSYPTAHQWYAMNLLVPLARFADGLSALERAHQLDPGSSAIAVSRGIVAFYAREYTAATDEVERASAQHPRFALAHYFLGLCRTFTGELEMGLASLAAAVELSDESSETLSAYGYALAVSGRTDEAESLLERLRSRATRRYVSQALVAQLLVGLGRHEEALAELRAAAASRATDLIWLAVRPQYDTLRSSQDFRAVLACVNLREPERAPP